MADARKLAAAALLRVEADGGYSNIVLNSALNSSEISHADRALASALFYGVLDRRITIDWLLSKHIKTPLKKVAPYTLTVLRCAVYQIAFMEKIPESAAVNEAVKLIKASGERRNAAFVNAVLRNIIRTGTDLPYGNDVRTLSVRYSCPEWIVKSFINDYGSENAVELLSQSLKTPPVTVRVNTVRTTPERLIKILEENNVKAAGTETENALTISITGDITALPPYKEGLFHIQDTASQTAAAVLAPKSGDRVLDMCAAPGGKSFTLAEIMENKGEITACDLYEQRVGLIKKGAERLGLDIIKPVCADASVFNPEFGQFDCILCDVPCSGLGVLRRKPDIKYRKPEDLSALAELQKKILKNALLYLKKGGRLLYSTCTLRREENEKLVNSVIMEYNDVHKAYEHTYMPHIDKTDGFYCALLIKEDNTAIG